MAQRTTSPCLRIQRTIQVRPLQQNGSCQLLRRRRRARRARACAVPTPRAVIRATRADRANAAEGRVQPHGKVRRDIASTTEADGLRPQLQNGSQKQPRPDRIAALRLAVRFDGRRRRLRRGGRRYTTVDAPQVMFSLRRKLGTGEDKRRSRRSRSTAGLLRE